MGINKSDKVTEYLYKKGGDGVNVRDLPPLSKGRYEHACGAYHAQGSRVNYSTFFLHLISSDAHRYWRFGIRFYGLSGQH